MLLATHRSKLLMNIHKYACITNDDYNSMDCSE